MTIQSLHPLYSKFAPKWQRCRDAYEGDDAIKARGEVYLPQPTGLNQTEYQAYKLRALFYEAVSRTISGFVGAIARKDPKVEGPKSLEAFISDATADGVPLIEFIKNMCAETMLQGRAGILCDFDEKLNRAYLLLYQAESIVNWSDTSIVINEYVYETDPKDALNQVTVQQYRQMVLVDGVYTVFIWRKNNNASTQDEEYIVHEGPIVPTRRGMPLKSLPFFWLSMQGRTSQVENPPLLGMVNVALSHYRNSADLEHGRHFTGLPTLYLTGMVDESKPINVGSTGILMLPDVNSKVGYAEFTGQGLRSLETALSEKEKMMGVLGASVFHDGPKGVEAAETARIRTSGETSLLMGVTTAVEATLECALQFACDWTSMTQERVKVTLNHDFINSRIDGATLTGLVQAFQSGALTINQFLFNLKEGQLLAPDTDLEVEAAAVEAARQKVSGV